MQELWSIWSSLSGYAHESLYVCTCMYAEQMCITYAEKHACMEHTGVHKRTCRHAYKTSWSQKTRTHAYAHAHSRQQNSVSKPVWDFQGFWYTHYTRSLPLHDQWLWGSGQRQSTDTRTRTHAQRERERERERETTPCLHVHLQAAASRPPIRTEKCLNRLRITSRPCRSAPWRLRQTRRVSALWPADLQCVISCFVCSLRQCVASTTIHRSRRNWMNMGTRFSRSYMNASTLHFCALVAFHWIKSMFFISVPHFGSSWNQKSGLLLEHMRVIFDGILIEGKTYWLCFACTILNRIFMIPTSIAFMHSPW